MSKKNKTEVEEELKPTAEAAEQAPVEDAESAEQQPSAEEALQAELAACREEVEKNKDLYLRNRAENENFRRRMQREKEELSKFANESILREVLPVIDNLERAVAHARENEGDSANLIEGVEMTLSQFQSVLGKFNVTAVEADGQPFDPACHEAMGQMESGDCAPNTVVQVLQAGYMLNDRLLRPALVMVSKAVAETETKEN